MLHGWSSTHHDPYDQRYYRTWMHELPPMQHIKRQAVIDVHHAILPESSAARPDPEKLRAAARPLKEDAELYVLAPIDMVLHSATHLFYEAEPDHGLRDLVDLDCLLRQFGALPEFWSKLVGRAQELELTCPLFYALRYTARVLQTPIPAEVTEQARVGAPHRLILAVMDGIYRQVFNATHPAQAGWPTCRLRGGHFMCAAIGCACRPCFWRAIYCIKRSRRLNRNDQPHLRAHGRLKFMRNNK